MSTSRLLLIPEAAERLNRSEATIRYWIQRGEFAETFKLGRRRVVREDVLEAWLSAQESAGAA
ncbi:AlpA family transcriptional regulator [Rathayibacter sp. AY1A2]|uniref:helix-turn-helix transcriptional regulator n=1 Tax=Rathayibacter sp. AY1A2 TaxID=2080520 RepID=UPI001C66D7E1|nr:helix-turn-helix domain-containing protein [Rathayibacter sp. AY1A2]